MYTRQILLLNRSEEVAGYIITTEFVIERVLISSSIVLLLFSVHTVEEGKKNHYGDDDDSNLVRWVNFLAAVLPPWWQREIFFLTLSISSPWSLQSSLGLNRKTAVCHCWALEYKAVLPAQCQDFQSTCWSSVLSYVYVLLMSISENPSKKK